MYAAALFRLSLEAALPFMNFMIDTFDQWLVPIGLSILLVGSLFPS